MAMSFSEYLSACMEATGYPTPASLSRETGISEGVLSRWLNAGEDANPPRTYMLRKLVPAFGVPLIELVVAARIMTPEEARLPDYPQPPQPVADEEIEELIANSSMSDEKKKQMRIEFLRLRRQAHEESRRTPVRRTRQNPDSGGNTERRGA